jgi:hypothetical protein
MTDSSKRRAHSKVVATILNAQIERKTGCRRVNLQPFARRKPNDALAWVERGLAMEKPNAFGRGMSDKLGEIRRAILVKLDRGGEALDSAWAEFQAQPGKFTYEKLVRYVPKAERGAWHEKAMDAAEQGGLESVIELWVGAKEVGRLAERLERTSDAKIEGLSHLRYRARGGAPR